MKNGIRQGIFLLLFLILLIVGSVLIDPAGRAGEGKMRDRNENVARLGNEEENTIDVLVLGDSMSYTAISPMVLWEEAGIATYAAGQSSQKSYEAYYRLRQALKTQEPKVVIIETGMLFNFDGRIDEAESLLNETMNYYFPLLHYHNMWKSNFVYEGEWPDTGNYKGFAIKTGIQPYTGGAYMEETQEREPIGDFIKLYTGKIVDLCKKNGIEVLLVSAPSPMNYNYARHNVIADYAADHDVSYLDMNLIANEDGTEIFDWQTDTLDQGDHLNVIGSEKATRYLAKYLTENYDLPDHRGESSYASWDELDAEFRDELERTLAEEQQKE